MGIFAAMSSKLRNILKYTASVLVAVVLLYLCFRNVKWADFRDVLLSCRWGFVALSMAFGVLSFWLRGVRWKLLINPIDPSVSAGSCFNAVNISYVVNMVLPRVGELVRCGYITRNSAPGRGGRKLASYDKVLGTVVLDRAWDVISMLAVLVITLALTWEKSWDFYRENVVDKAVGGVNLSWILLPVLTAAVIAFAAVWYFRGRSGACAKIWGFITGIWRGVTSSLHMRHGWLFVAVTVGIWACYWMMSVTVIWALQGMDIGEGTEALRSMGMLDALFLMVVGATSSVVPVPGGFGAYHYLLSLAVQGVYGIPMATGIILATLSHESQVVVQLLCGGVSYFAEAFKKRK